MRNKKYLWTIASFLSVLVISLPITLAQEINYVTDANGNLVTGDSFYREYNELNQLIRVRQGNISTGPILEEYEWHPTEERILIKDVFSNGVKNYTVYYVSKEYVVIENSTGNYTEEYIYQDGVLVAQVDTNGNKFAVHSDYEGSTTTITDANGNVAEQTFFGPYGQIISGGQKLRYDYEGKEFDSVVEDYDFNFRKYKPEPPIFTQPDTLIQNVYDPQQLNRYAFERNNPYKYTDPTGHQYQAEIGKSIVLGTIAVILHILQVIGATRVSKDINDEANKKEAQVSDEQDDNKNQKIQEAKSAKDVLELIDKISNDANLASAKNSNQKTEIPSEVLNQKDNTKQLEIQQKDLKKIKKFAKGTIELEPIKIEIKKDENKPKGTISRGGGKRGGSNVIPDPSGRKDRRGQPIYIIRP